MVRTHGLDYAFSSWLSPIESVTSFRPFAIDCFWPWVNDTTGMAVMLVLPWFILLCCASVCVLVPRWKDAAVLAFSVSMNTLYLPVAHHAFSVLNTDSTTVDGRCFLKLSPDIDCSTSDFGLLQVLAWLTLVVMLIAYPLLTLAASTPDVLRRVPALAGVNKILSWYQLQRMENSSPWVFAFLQYRKLILAAIVDGPADYQQV